MKCSVYLGSEVWMARIPCLRFNKGYIRAKGVRGPELPGTVEGAETAQEEQEILLEDQPSHLLPPFSCLLGNHGENHARD